VLVQEPSAERGPGEPTRTRPRSAATYAFLTLAAIGVLVMRHDYWNWDTPYPLLFGVLPVALWWQALVSLSACVLMWLMVRLAWPYELEDAAFEADQRVRSASGDGVTGRDSSAG
jgi:hypothetical protein